MTTIETIQNAISILQSHDFYYQMSDNYRSAHESAEASMKHFVQVTNTLTAEMRQLMRDLWVANYDYYNCMAPFFTAPDIDEKRAHRDALQAKVDALIAA